MSAESDFIASLRAFASHPAARGLADDTAVLEIGGKRLVVTHDMIVEGVHFLSSDAPADIAWKLLAVNLSDLAAKGATPVGALLGYMLAPQSDWDAAFVDGLGRALSAFGLPLLGGDTVAAPPASPRSFGLTAFGRAVGAVPSRAGACPGDSLWVSGAIGDAGLGLRICRGELEGAQGLVERYRLPAPRLELGQRLAPLVSAMMDISDGLLIDAGRMAAASGVAIGIELPDIPLSAAFLDAAGEGRGARLAAATSGDDYELLFTAPKSEIARVLELSETLAIPLSRVGWVEAGSGLRLMEHGLSVPLPGRLGFEHSAVRPS